MTHTRRQFLALSGAAMPLMGQRGFPGRPGLQMYSLRREAARDLQGTLALIQRLGFEELEVGNLFGHKAGEFRKMLEAHGLKAVSMGAEWPQLTHSVDEAADKARALGVQ